MGSDGLLAGPILAHDGSLLEDLLIRNHYQGHRCHGTFCH